jgi:hypothetical protein
VASGSCTRLAPTSTSRPPASKKASAEQAQGGKVCHLGALASTHSYPNEGACLVRNEMGRTPGATRHLRRTLQIEAGRSPGNIARDRLVVSQVCPPESPRLGLSYFLGSPQIPHAEHLRQHRPRMKRGVLSRLVPTRCFTQQLVWLSESSAVEGRPKGPPLYRSVIGASAAVEPPSSLAVPRSPYTENVKLR